MPDEVRCVQHFAVVYSTAALLHLASLTSHFLPALLWEAGGEKHWWCKWSLMFLMQMELKDGRWQEWVRSFIGVFAKCSVGLCTYFPSFLQADVNEDHYGLLEIIRRDLPEGSHTKNTFCVAYLSWEWANSEMYVSWKTLYALQMYYIVWM